MPKKQATAKTTNEELPTILLATREWFKMWSYRVISYKYNGLWDQTWYYTINLICWSYRLWLYLPLDDKVDYDILIIVSSMHHNCGFAAIMKPNNDICGEQNLLNHGENFISCLCKEAGEYWLQIITDSEDHSQGRFSSGKSDCRVSPRYSVALGKKMSPKWLKPWIHLAHDFEFWCLKVPIRTFWWVRSMKLLYFEMLEYWVVCPFVKRRQLSLPISLTQQWILLLIVLTHSH